MNCRRARWLISKALNEDAQLPVFVAHHLDRCRGCAVFLEASRCSGDRLKGSAFATGPGSVVERVMVAAS